jgi:hypothetical protein
MIDTSAIKQINTGDKTTRDVICNPRIVRMASANKERESKKEREKGRKKKVQSSQKNILFNFIFRSGRGFLDTMSYIKSNVNYQNRVRMQASDHWKWKNIS